MNREYELTTQHETYIVEYSYFEGEKEGTYSPAIGQSVHIDRILLLHKDSSGNTIRIDLGGVISDCIEDELDYEYLETEILKQ